MKVLFDFQGLVQKHSGGSKMYFELMKHFPPEVTYEVGLRECDNVHLQRLKLLDLKSASNLNGNLNCSKELEHYAS